MGLISGNVVGNLLGQGLLTTEETLFSPTGVTANQPVASGSSLDFARDDSGLPEPTPSALHAVSVKTTNTAALANPTGAFTFTFNPPINYCDKLVIWNGGGTGIEPNNGINSATVTAKSRGVTEFTVNTNLTKATADTSIAADVIAVPSPHFDIDEIIVQANTNHGGGSAEVWLSEFKAGQSGEPVLTVLRSPTAISASTFGDFDSVNRPKTRVIDGSGLIAGATLLDGLADPALEATQWASSSQSAGFFRFDFGAEYAFNLIAVWGGASTVLAGTQQSPRDTYYILKDSALNTVGTVGSVGSPITLYKYNVNEQGKAHKILFPTISGVRFIEYHQSNNHGNPFTLLFGFRAGQIALP